MTRRIIQARDSLDRLLRYALGVQPDEFGLVLSEEGKVPLKELIAALREEDGFRGLSENRVREAVNQSGDRAFELSENHIRLKPELSQLPPRRELGDAVPKELFIGLREGGWAVASQKGLFPKRPTEDSVRLFLDEATAMRVAKRFNPEPVPVRVFSGKAALSGVAFSPYGDAIWLTNFVPGEFLSGPRIKAEEEEKEPQGKKKEPKEDSLVPKPLTLAMPQPSHGKKKGKYADSPDWKTRQRKERRDKGGGRDRDDKE
jgi:putative RNA 2'-phosphotransferase